MLDAGRATGQKRAMTLPKTARASILTKAREPLELRELPVVPPGEGEVLVKVVRANVCGSDLHLWSGEAFGGMPVPFPMTLGHELVGRVAALGEGVSSDAVGAGLRPGDLVTFCYWRGCGACPVCARGQGHACLQSLMSLVRPAEEPPHFVGGFAEYYSIRRGQAVFKLPDGIDPSLAAGINCALAQVVHGLDVAGIRHGDQVVIQGAGGLGLWAVVVAKQRGAGKVVVLDGVAERLELARALGADHTVSVAALDPRQRTEAVKGVTGGGADLLVEVVGRADALKEGTRMVARGGRYLVMGNINPRQKVEIDPSVLVLGNVTMFGVSLYPAHVLPQAAQLVRRVQEGLPLGRMMSVHPFERINEAMAAAAGRGAVRVQLQMEM
jgi:D-arabinose 1-dehydrogenase-like Zn-dependent alcohol dehydrogenase